MNIDPAMLAQADQDLATTRQKLRVILELWRDDRTQYSDGVERVSRLMGFMSDTGVIALRALLAVAIEQLVEEKA